MFTPFFLTYGDHPRVRTLDGIIPEKVIVLKILDTMTQAKKEARDQIGKQDRYVKSYADKTRSLAH